MADFDAFDTIVNLTPAQCAALRNAGVVTVLRYLAHSSSIGKIIKPVEAATIRASGLHLVFNWEQAADSLLTASAATIRQWGLEAGAAAILCGAQRGDVIPLSLDFDVTPAQWDGVVAGHLQVFDGALFEYALNGTVYGSGYACRRALAAGYPPPWQAMSTGWRESKTTAAGIAVRQLREQTVAGVPGDVNKIVIPNSWAGPSGPTGGPTVATTDQYITALMNGSDKTPDGKPVSPVLWQVANEQRFAGLSNQLDDVAQALAGLSTAGPGGGLTPADRQAIADLSAKVDRLNGTLVAMAAAVPSQP